MHLPRRLAARGTELLKLEPDTEGVNCVLRGGGGAEERLRAAMSWPATELRKGERVLDLGSGGGIDVVLSARRVGPTGRAYGVDMTEEMLALALANAKKAGATNVEFLRGTIESVPLPAKTIDVVISNCVLNLSVDKPTVFAEMFRVLAPGGRIGTSDVVSDDHLTSQQRAVRGDHVGCIAGTLSFAEYRQGLAAAGFTGVQITPTCQVAESMHSAIVLATKPVALAAAERAGEFVVGRPRSGPQIQHLAYPGSSPTFGGSRTVGAGRGQ